MFCIINLRHNSTYVAPPAAGRPPFFSTHAPPLLGEGMCVFTDGPARGVVLYLLQILLKANIVTWFDMHE